MPHRAKDQITSSGPDLLLHVGITTIRETVSEESEEEGSTSTVERNEDDQSSKYPKPYPYPQEYGAEAQKVNVDVHSSGQNGTYVPPAPKQKRMIDTTPNLKGDEWDQMLNGRLKDASEEEEKEEVIWVNEVKTENEKLQDGEEWKRNGVGHDEGVKDSDEDLGAELVVDRGRLDIHKIEMDDLKMEELRNEQLITEEADPEDSELLVINYGKTTSSHLEMNDSQTIQTEEHPGDSELVVINYGETTSSDYDMSDSRAIPTEEQVGIEDDFELEVEKPDEESISWKDSDQETQTEGDLDVHVDITNDVSHTITVKSSPLPADAGRTVKSSTLPADAGRTVKSSTLPADAGRAEPNGTDRKFTTASQRGSGGTLSKIKRDDFRKASRASLASLYSNADESYRLLITGDVNFGTSYNYKTNTFDVKIMSCRDLVPVDAKRNRSNPYVKLYLLPDKSKPSKRKTNVHKSTINPIFSETLKYKIMQSELETRTLCVAVWHYDRFGHNLFMGENLMSLDTVQFDDYSPKWHSLSQRQRKSSSVLTYTGDVMVAVMYEPLSAAEEKDTTSRYHKGKKNKPPGKLLGGTLQVHIKEAKNLVGMKLGGSSSPVCKCYLLPDRSKHGKKKTTVKRNTCNPKWTDTLNFEDVTRDSLLERCLEITVWDFDSIGSNSLMGGVRLGLGSGKSYGKAVDWMDSSGKEVSVWREMLKHPDHWVETTMTLRGNVGKTKK